MKSTKLLVLTNLPDRAVAEKLAALLVESQLAACVNILAPCRSVYPGRAPCSTTKSTRC